MAVTVTDLDIRAHADTGSAEAAIGRLNNKVGESPGFFSRAASGALGFIAATGAMRVIGSAFDFAGSSIIGFNSLMEQSTIGFTTMLGSGEKAQAFLTDLQSFAATTPFRFEGLVASSQRLLAMGFAADEIKPTLSAVGDAMAALGQGDAGIDRATFALGQMRAAGRATAGDMNQLTQLGIPAWDILAQHAGVSVAEIRKMSEQGLVDSETAITALTAGMNERFGGLMASQARTFSGAASTIMDSAQILIAGAFRPLYDQASLGLQAIAAWASSPAATAFGENIAAGMGRGVQAISDFVGTIASDLGPALADSGFRFGMLLDAAKFVFETVLSVAQRVWPTIATVINTASGIVTAAFTAIAGWVSSNWPAISRIVEAAGDVIVSAFRGIGEVVGVAAPILMRVGEVVFPIIGAAASAALPLIEGILDVLKGVFDAVAGGGPATEGTLIGVGSALAAIAAYKMVGVVQGLVSFFASILTSGPGAIGMLRGIGLAVTSAFGPVGLIIAGITAVVAALFLAWQTNFGGIREITATVIAAVSGFIQGFLDWLGTVPATVGAFIAGIVAFFAAMPGQIIGFFTGLWTSLSTWWTKTVAAVTAFASRLVTGIVTWIAGLPGRVMAFYVNLAVSIATWFGTLIRNVVMWAGSVVNGIATAISAMPGRVIAWHLDMLNRIATFFGGLASSAGTWASRVVTAVVNFFATLPIKALAAIGGMIGTIGGFFRGLPVRIWSAITGAGAAIVRGLWSGISGLAGWLWDKVAAWVSGLIDGVLSFLGISSPSTVFRGIGENIVKGLAGGISGTARVASDAMGGIVGGVVTQAGVVDDTLRRMQASLAALQLTSYRGPDEAQNLPGAWTQRQNLTAGIAARQHELKFEGLQGSALVNETLRRLRASLAAVGTAPGAWTRGQMLTGQIAEQEALLARITRNTTLAAQEKERNRLLAAYHAAPVPAAPPPRSATGTTIVNLNAERFVGSQDEGVYYTRLIERNLRNA